MDKDRFSPFREGLFESRPDGACRLLANRCLRCGLTYFPRRQFCPQCEQSDRMEEIRLGSRGILYTFTEVHRAPPDFPTPYIIGYVDLPQDGVRLFAPITGCRAEELRIGMEMELTFGPGPRQTRGERGTGTGVYQFRAVHREGGPS